MTHVKLHLGCAYLVVEPTYPQGLLQKLTYFHKQMVQDDKGRLRSSGESVKLYTTCESIDPDTMEVSNNLVTMPGFLLTVMTILTASGISFEIVDERVPPPEYDLMAGAKGLRDYQYAAAYDIITNGGGRLQCPTAYGKTYLMAAILNAYSKESLTQRNTPLSLVITPGLDLLQKNWAKFVEILPYRDVGIRCSRKKKQSDDIMVISADSLDHFDMDQVGIIIYDECHTLTYGRALNLIKAKEALRWGFSASPTGRFDGSDLLGHGVFGPIVHRCTYQQAIKSGAVVPIHVVWLEAPDPTGGFWKSPKTKTAARRAGIWRNAKMHRQIEELWRRFPADWQIIGVGESTEHLNFLKHFVGDSAIVHAKTRADELKGLRYCNLSPVTVKERNKIYKLLESGELKRAISTAIYRQGVDFPHLRAIVNLAGGGSEIAATQLPGRASRLDDGKEAGILFDFRHSYDFDSSTGRPGYLLRDSAAREEVYRELGFSQTWFTDVNDVTWLK